MKSLGWEMGGERLGDVKGPGVDVGLSCTDLVADSGGVSEGVGEEGGGSLGFIDLGGGGKLGFS